MTPLASPSAPESPGSSDADHAIDVLVVDAGIVFVDSPSAPPDGKLAAAQPALEFIDAEPVSEDVVEAEVVTWKSLPVRFWRGLCSALEWLFGLACLLVGLAVLASVPVLQFLALGYLLESSGRIARKGRLRDGFIGIRGAARIGGFILGPWLWLLPIRLSADLWYDAWLIDPQSAAARGWSIGFTLLTVAILIHIAWAWLRGGRVRHFLWPAPVRLVKTLPRLGGQLSQKADELWEFAAQMRVPYYFWLGLRGFAGAIVWLFVPTLLLIAAPRFDEPGAGVLFGLLGGVLMAAVLLYLPFLQTHFAAENRFWAFFEWQRVRAMFRQAPLAFWCSLFITLLFALPLYLFKIEIIPREALWLPGLVFISFIFPARLLTGWAVGLANRREKPRHWVFRWMARLAAVPVVVVFTFILFMTQYISWYGAASLFEQHAFLTPVPFLGG
jgi:hypothetical protein